jgi:hypothetical protein
VFSAGCCKVEFDSTYPIQLNGIIGQSEFRESIEKINRSSFSSGAMKAIIIIYILTILIPMLCFIFGRISADNSHVFGLPILAAVAMGVSIVGTIIFIIVVIIIRVRRVRRMREVITKESMKYSVRSPTPCSWRLETTTFYERYENNNYRVSILQSN